MDADHAPTWVSIQRRFTEDNGRVDSVTKEPNKGVLTSYAPYTMKGATDQFHVSGGGYTDATHVYTTFSAPVGTGATMAANYTISNALTLAPVNVTEAAVDGANSSKVNLTTNSLTPGEVYKVTVAGVASLSGGQLDSERNYVLLAAPSGGYQMIPLPLYNRRLQEMSGASNQYPEGRVNLGGVPFYIPVGGLNEWAAWAVPGPNPKVLELPVGIDGVQIVHTLINTGYGIPGPQDYAKIEFIGSAGAHYVKKLIGDDDIRDHLLSAYTNYINGVTTTNVFVAGSGLFNQVRFDKQAIVLPFEFRTQRLDRILVSDYGIDDSEVPSQRIFLAGLTVGTSAIQTACREDVNRSSAVDIEDALQVIRVWAGLGTCTY